MWILIGDSGFLNWLEEGHPADLLYMAWIRSSFISSTASNTGSTAIFWQDAHFSSLQQISRQGMSALITQPAF